MIKLDRTRCLSTQYTHWDPSRLIKMSLPQVLRHIRQELRCPRLRKFNSLLSLSASLKRFLAQEVIHACARPPVILVSARNRYAFLFPEVFGRLRRQYVLLCCSTPDDHMRGEFSLASADLSTPLAIFLCCARAIPVAHIKLIHVGLTWSDIMFEWQCRTV